MSQRNVVQNFATLAEEFTARSPFPLDPFQKAAITDLEAGRSVLVSAPTSAGKTVIAEFAIERALRSQQQLIYTAPIKALSNQKYGDFGRYWGFHAIGLLTGDIAINKEAPVLVMTTEVLRNMLLQTPESVRHVQTVVLDEFHYLADPERGRVWEEIVILLPSETQLVCLSASMANASELRAWISRVHGETALILHDVRPVPLEVHYFADGQLQLVMDAQGHHVRTLRIGAEERYYRRRGRLARWNSSSQLASPTAAEVIAELRSRQLLPTLYFLFNRARTESEAAACAERLNLIPTVEAREQIHQAIAETIMQLPEEVRALPQVRTLLTVLQYGIAFHHAGLLPVLKVLVETLFAQGALGAVFATETLALGINMPARSVVIPQLTKFDGTVRRPLSGQEFQQLIGRAGRRGMDTIGHAVLVHDPKMSFDEAMRVVKRPLEPVISSFSLSYNSLINLLLTYGNPTVLTQIMNRSLLAHQLITQRKRLQAQVSRIQKQLLALPLRCPACGESRPFSRCSRYREHERQFRMRRSYQEQIELLEAQIEHGKQVEERDLRSILDDALNIMTYFGYFSEGVCAPDAHVLARIVDQNALLLTELVLGPELDNVTPSQLAEVISWFAQPDGESHLEQLPSRFRPLWLAVRKVAAAIAERELTMGVVITPGPSLVFPGLVDRWCNGEPFIDLLRGLKVAEGDLIRYLKKTADLLRQITHALADTGRKPLLQRLAEEAEGLVRRDLVRLQELAEWKDLEEVPEVEEAIEEESALLAALAQEAWTDERSVETASV